MNNYKAILIGHGTMGKRHRARFESCGVQFVKILDSKAGKKCEDPDSNADCVEIGCTPFSEDPIVNDADVDFVVIASPASTHYEYVKKYLELKVPVFVEKPLATSGAQAQELYDLAKRNNTILFVAQSECFNPIFLNFRKSLKIELRECLELHGDSTAPLNAKLEFRREHRYSERCRDIGVALDLMVHDLSLFLTLFNYEDVSVENFIQNSDDEAWAFMRVKSGKFKGVEATFKVNRNSVQDVRTITASFEDAEYIVSLAKYMKNGEVDHIADSLENEHRFFLKLLAGACTEWGWRAAQNAANVVKLIAP